MKSSFSKPHVSLSEFSVVSGTFAVRMGFKMSAIITTDCICLLKEWHDNDGAGDDPQP